MAKLLHLKDCRIIFNWVFYDQYLFTITANIVNFFVVSAISLGFIFVKISIIVVETIFVKMKNLAHDNWFSKL